MRYSNFTIENFKGIIRLNLDFSIAPKFKVFTLVGLNESGKTSILEAIDLLHKDIPIQERYKLIPKSKGADFTGDILIRAELDLDGKDEESIKNFALKEHHYNISAPVKKIVIEKKYNFDNANAQEGGDRQIKLSISGHTKSKRHEKSSLLKESSKTYQGIKKFIDEELIPPIIYYPNFEVTFPEKIFLQESENEPKEQKFYRDVVKDILVSIDKNWTIEDQILSRMNSQTPQEKSALATTMNKMGEKVTTIILNLWEEIYKQKTDEKETRSSHNKRDKRRIVITPETTKEGRHCLKFSLQVGGDSYEIEDLSLGFKWFVAFLLFTQFRKYRYLGKKQPLFLIDEPASNLHSTAQSRLLESIRSLIDESMLIYTTHSHHLIKGAWLEGAFVVQNKAFDYNKIDYDAMHTDIDAMPYRIFVGKYPDKETYFKPILDSLDYRPSELEMVSPIIIVEGKNDFYTLKYINDVILGKKKVNLNFYPGNGAGKNNQVIRLYLSWVRKFVVLMDGDVAGIDAKEKYIDEIGKIIEDKIFTLKDINPKWNKFKMEDLFTSNPEKLRVAQFISPKATQVGKTTFNRAIQNLLFAEEKAQINEATQRNFLKVLNFLKQKLDDQNK